MLAAIETHPIQYRGPLFRLLQQELQVPVTAIYGSDFSVAGYRDSGFGATFQWDTDLLSGYDSLFLSRTSRGGASRMEDVRATGLTAALDRLRPRAVLISGYSPAFHRAGFLAAWRAGYPILFRGETTSMERASGLKKRAKDFALGRFYSRCRKLLYIGEGSREHYRMLGCDERKLIFSPYFVDSSPFRCSEGDRAALREDTRAALGLAGGRLVLLFSGKLAPYKGPDLLVAAAKLLPPALQERVTILFLGAGELESSLRGAAQASPAIDVRFTGFQNQTALSPYYHAADALVLPSHWDTWGLVVNEALHHGLPCVATDRVGSARDLLIPGETGEVCAHNSPESLAAAIQRVALITGAAATREHCRLRVSGYTIRQAAEGIARAYREVTA